MVGPDKVHQGIVKDMGRMTPHMCNINCERGCTMKYQWVLCLHLQGDSVDILVDDDDRVFNNKTKAWMFAQTMGMQ